MSPDATPRLGLPYLAAAQAQKHVTLNESLATLDALVGCAVRSRTTAAQPAAPDEGDAYVLPPGASGEAWAAAPAGSLMRFADGGWATLSTPAGLVAFIADEGVLVLWTGAAWVSLAASLGELADLDRLGVGTAPDAVNRLTVGARGALFTHANGDDMRLTVNKATAAATASVVLATGFSARAELGLTGDDTLHVKTSADGTTWTEAVRIGPAGEPVALPGGRLDVLSDDGTVPVRIPGGDWAARFVNGRNAPAEHGALVANLWYSTDSWVLLVGTANGAVSGATLAPFFGVRGDGRAEFNGTVRIGSVSKTALPPAATQGAGALAFVPDEASGPVLAYSDGATWRRVRDGAAVG